MPIGDTSSLLPVQEPSANHNQRSNAFGGTATDGSNRHGEKVRLKQACADFEALLIQKLFQTMRASIPKSGLIGGGSAEEIYTAMLDQKVAQEMALKGSLGLSTQVKQQIVRYMDKLKFQND